MILVVVIVNIIIIIIIMHSEIPSTLSSSNSLGDHKSVRSSNYRTFLFGDFRGTWKLCSNQQKFEFYEFEFDRFYIVIEAWYSKR